MSVAAAPINVESDVLEIVTPEEMSRLPDDGRLLELVDGQLVEKRMSDVAQLVASNVNNALVLWSQGGALGRSLVESSFRCFPHDPGMVRRPDVAFVTAERLANYVWGRGHFTLTPDLAVEVVSPNDEVLELDRKISDYFRAGVRRVWVMNPDLKILRVHRAMGDLSELIGDAAVVDEVLLPGFRSSLPSLFMIPGATPAHP